MAWIEQHWQRFTPVSALLTPLSALFGGIAALRRQAFKLGLSRQHDLPVPVVVVGNISVGGTGKTPLTIQLARRLCQLGYHPGIISRGYGGSATEPTVVYPDSNPDQVGDEPVLIARHTALPVVVCRDRAAAGHALLKAHPECNLLLCDDGLQHYPLARDVEIAVVDGARGFGNGLLLPAGPLREPQSRLQQVDAIVLNGFGQPTLPQRPVFQMHLTGGECYRLSAPHETRPASDFIGHNVIAVAGIGHPERFFMQLRGVGLQPRCYAFPDHHQFTPEELAFPGCDFVLLTEKDAVKCAGFKDDRIWVFPVSAEIEPDLAQFVVEKLRQHGSQTA